MVARSRRAATSRQREALAELHVNFRPKSDAQCGMLLRYLRETPDVRLEHVNALYRARVEIIAEGSPYRGQAGNVTALHMCTVKEAKDITFRLGIKAVRLCVLVSFETGETEKFCPSEVKIKVVGQQRLFLFT